MSYPQMKTIVAVNAVSKTAAATASGLIDTLGYDWCTIDIIAATADVVSNKPTVLKLQEADTTDATNLANVSGFRRRYGLHDPERQHGGDCRPAE
jgi:hypothetical protein